MKTAMQKKLVHKKCKIIRAKRDVVIPAWCRGDGQDIYAETWNGDVLDVLGEYRCTIHIKAADYDRIKRGIDRNYADNSNRKNR